MQLQKEMVSIIQNSSALKSVLPQEGCCEKRCEIKGGSQEMAVMAG